MVGLHYMAKVKGFPPIAPSMIKVASCLCVDSQTKCKTSPHLQREIHLNHFTGQRVYTLIVQSTLQVRPRKEVHTGPETYLCLSREEIPGSQFPRMWSRKGGGDSG